MAGDGGGDAGTPVRLILIDDHEMVIEGLKAMLAAFSDRVQVVGQAVGAERAISVIDELQPDIVLCDVRMQGASGLDLCRELRERDPDRKVVMLSVYDDEQYLYPGAAGRRGGLSAQEHQQRRAWCVSWSWCTAARRPSTRAWPPGPPTPPRVCNATSSGPAPAKD